MRRLSRSRPRSGKSRRRAVLFAAVLVAAVVAPREGVAAPATVPSAPRIIEIATARVHFHDLGIPGSAMPDVDLGPAPALGGARTIDREEITRALTAASAPAAPKLPAQVRIVRKARRLTASDVDKLVRAAIEPARIPRATTVTTVRATALQVPDGFDRVTVDLPTLPRRSGTVTVTAAVSFVSGGDVLARITVPVDFNVPAEALVPDVAKGAAITLLVRRGLVEISIGAVAGADGDTGGILPVLLKPSGRVVRARIVDKDHAVALEDS